MRGNKSIFIFSEVFAWMQCNGVDKEANHVIRHADTAYSALCANTVKSLIPYRLSNTQWWQAAASAVAEFSKQIMFSRLA